MTELEYGATKIKIERENEEKLKHYPILQKQLDIAVGTLRCYGNPNNWDGNRFTNFFATWQLARNNLDKIEELNK
jgi:hypothetical protein